MISLAYNFYDDGKFDRGEIRILGLYSPTILFSIGGVMTSLCCKGQQTKPYIETVLILVNLVAWIIIGIATLIGTSYYFKDFIDLAIDASGDEFEIGEPNIYFFSFGSLYNAVILFSSWFKEYILRDKNSLTTTQWTLLALSGFLVMAVGFSRINVSSCNNGNYYTCGHNTVSILVGLISGICGCIMIPWRTAPLKCQAELAFILLVTWGLAIAFLTFGTGPALYINTMYLGIFISFFLSMNIFSTTLYADSVLEASPNSQIEFGRTESQMADDGLGAAGILDMAFANITRQSTDENLNNDPRRDDESTAILFEAIGDSIASWDDQNATPRSQSGRGFNRKVVVGKREYSRVEVWFWLFLESSICLAVFSGEINTCESVIQQWIIITPSLSIALSVVGWFTSSIKKKSAYYFEGILVSPIDIMRCDTTNLGVLEIVAIKLEVPTLASTFCPHFSIMFNQLCLGVKILVCIILWMRGLIAITRYFLIDTTDGDRTICEHISNEPMTANQLFMSYGSFFTSLYLITEWSDASVTTADWIFLTAAAGTIFGVVFINNPDVFQKCSETCDLRIKLVVALSLGSAAISFIMVLVSFVSCGKVVPIVHVIIGNTLLVLWCIGSYFIVFEKEGVGAEIGPTFFACWGSLFFCVDIATTNLVLLFNQKKEGDEDLESLSSLHSGEIHFVDEGQNIQGLNDNVKTNGFGLKTVSEHARGEDEAPSIITQGVTLRIKYNQSEARAQHMFSENSSSK